MRSRDEKVIEKQNVVRKDTIDAFIACRNNCKLTQQMVADATGVKRPNITRFENGAYNPSLDMLVKVADAMNMDVKVSLVPRSK